MRRFPIFGMRIVKTSISVMICLIIAHLLGRPTPIYACLAAIIVVREDLKTSFKQGVARIISTVVGCLVALVIMRLNAQNYYLHILFTGVGCALTIYFCVLIKNPDAASLAAMIFLSLALEHPGDRYEYAITRLIETIAGILIAVAVNMIPRRKKEIKIEAEQ